jgi:hypothetical protein
MSAPQGPEEPNRPGLRMPGLFSEVRRQQAHPSIVKFFLLIFSSRWGIVTHTCNPSYWQGEGGRCRRIKSSRPDQAKTFSKTLSQKPVILATPRDREDHGSRPAGAKKFVRPYLQNKQQTWDRYQCVCVGGGYKKRM